MGLSVDKMVISVSIETDAKSFANIKKGTQDAEKQFDNLSSGINKTEKNLEKLNKTQVRFSKSGIDKDFGIGMLNSLALIEISMKKIIEVADALAEPIKIINIENLVEAEKHLSSIEKKYGSIDSLASSAAISKQAQELNKTLILQNQILAENSQQLQNISQNISAVSEGQAQAAKSTSLLGGIFKMLGRTIALVFRSKAILIAGIGALVVAIELLANAERLKKISQLFRFLSVMAKVRGFDGISQGLKAAAEQVDIFTDGLIGTRDKVFNVFTTIGDKGKFLFHIFEAYEKYADTLFTLLSVSLAVAATVGAIRALSFAVVNIHKILPEVAVAFLNKTKILPNVAMGLNSTTSAVEQLNSRFSMLGRNINSAFTPGILGLTEKAFFLSKILHVLGKSFEDSESAVFRFFSQISLLASFLLGEFALVSVKIIGYLGDMATAFGGVLLGAMRATSAEFEDFQKTVTQLTLAVEGFGEYAGTEAVGSTQMWTEALERLSKTTGQAQNSIAESMRLLVAEGTRLGLNYEANMELLETSIDLTANASAKNKDLTQSTQALLSALQGSPQALQALGLDLRDAAVEKSKFLKLTNLTTSELDEESKVTLRLAEIMRQSIPFRGASAKSMETISGSAKRLENNISLLNVRLGASTFAITEYNNIMSELVSVLHRLPAPMLSFIGFLADAAGISLIAFGAIAKNIMIVLTLSTSYNLLTLALNKNIVTQGVANKLFTFLGKILSVQVIAVTSATAAYTNLSKILGVVIVKSLVLLRQTFLKTASALGMMFVALLPLLAKLFALAAIIGGAAIAIQSFLKETTLGATIMDGFSASVDFLTQALGLSGNETGFLASFFANLLDICIKVTLVVAKLASILVKGLLGAIVGVSLALIELIRLLPMAESWKQRLSGVSSVLSNTMNELGESITGQALSIEKLVSGSALASEEVGQLSSFFERFTSSMRLTSKEADDLAKNLITLARATGMPIAELKKFTTENIDQFQSILDQNKTLSSQIMARGKLSIQVANIDRKASINKILETKKLILEQEKLNKLPKELNKILTDNIALINQAYNAQALEEVNKVFKENESIQNSISQIGMNETQIADDKLRLELLEIATLREKLDLNNENEASLDAQLGIQADLLKEQRKAQQDEQDKKGKEAKQIISPEMLKGLKESVGSGAANLAGGISGALSGAVGVVGAITGAVDAVHGALKAIIDFIPGLFDKVADIFNSITELPMKIVSSLGNMLDSITKYISEYLINFIEAIPQILSSLIEFFVEGIPAAFESLLTSLPEAIMGLLNRIPELVERLVSGLIGSMPRVTIAIIEFFIQHAPAIAMRMMQVFYIELPKAIINGIINGVKEFIKRLQAFFSGKPFDIGVKGITDNFKKVAKSFANEASQLFKVLDLEEAGKAFGEADPITEGVKKMKDMWAGLMNALRAVWDWVIKSLTKVWDFVKMLFDSFIKLNQRIWEFVNRVIIQPTIMLLKRLFEIGKTIHKAIMSAFSDAAKNLGSVFYNLGATIWEGLKAGLSTAGAFLTKIFDTLNPENLFAKIFRIPPSGTGPVEEALRIDVPFANFAMGGYVPGSASVPGDSLVNDRILALLSPGEAVIPRSVAQDPQKQPFVQALLGGNMEQILAFFRGSIGGVSVAMPSVSMPNIGGVVGGVIDTAAQAVSEMTSDVLDMLARLDPSRLWKEVENQFFGNFMKVFEANKFHQGGFVGAQFAFGGEVPAMLQPGEYVLNRNAVGNLGRGLLDKMNGGASPGGGGTTNYNIDINMKIDASATKLDEVYVRNKLIPEIKTELKKSSLRGEFLISQKGTRSS